MSAVLDALPAQAEWMHAARDLQTRRRWAEKPWPDDPEVAIEYLGLGQYNRDGMTAAGKVPSDCERLPNHPEAWEARLRNGDPWVACCEALGAAIMHDRCGARRAAQEIYRHLGHLSDGVVSAAEVAQRAAVAGGLRRPSLERKSLRNVRTVSPDDLDQLERERWEGANPTPESALRLLSVVDYIDRTLSEWSEAPLSFAVATALEIATDMASKWLIARMRATGQHGEKLIIGIQNGRYKDSGSHLVTRLRSKGEWGHAEWEDGPQPGAAQETTEILARILTGTHVPGVANSWIWHAVHETDAEDIPAATKNGLLKELADLDRNLALCKNRAPTLSPAYLAYLEQVGTTTP